MASWLPIGALLLLVVRALFAALEAALVAVGLPRAEALARLGRRGKALRDLIKEPEPTGAVMRVVENFTVLFAGLLAAMFAAAWPVLPPHWVAPIYGVAAALAAFGLSAAGRALGTKHGEAVGLWLSVPVAWLRPVLAPLGALVAWIAWPLTGGRGRYALPRPPLEEMERWLTENAKLSGGRPGDATSELIHRVFEFREKVARDLMVARTRVVAIDIDTPVPEVIRVLAEEGHSRMPVYRGDLDHIVGTLHARDLVPLLVHPELIVLRDLVRPAHFVPWSKPVDQLLKEMQKKKLHMGIVVDEYGGVMGLCTLEDVLEEIVGEIRDEFEETEEKNVEVSADGTLVVRGTTPIAEFNRVARADLPEDQDYETMAGFLNALAGAIPNAGERFVWRGLVFTVVERSPKRVTRVRVSRQKSRAPTGSG